MKTKILIWTVCLLSSIGSLWAQTDISGAAVTISAENMVPATYTGNPVETTELGLMNGTTPLVSGTDYSMEVLFNGNPVTQFLNAGTYSVTFTGLAPNYTGTKTASYTIAPANLSSVTFAIHDQTFTGNAITPTADQITGTFGSTTLTSTDFTVGAATNNTNAGTASVTLTGTGNFTGTATVNFTILPADISGATITIADQAFTGSAITPASTDISGTFGSYTLTDTDYTIGTASNNTNAGTASVVLNGAGNFTGTQTVNFIINPVDISTATITIADKVFTGEDIQLSIDGSTAVGDVNAMLGSYQLTGRDMTLGSYTNNRNVGTASVVITGAGNFTGTTTVNFNITPAALTDVAVVFDPASYTYTGAQITPTYKVTLNGVELQPTDYTAVLGANINAGPTAGLVTLQASTNLTGSDANFAFEITPKDITNAVINGIPDTMAYTGSAIEPVPTMVTVDTFTLTTADYTVMYRANTEAGIASVFVVANSGNFTGSSNPKTFVITKPLSHSDITASVPNQTYTGSPITPTNIRVLDKNKVLVMGTDFQIKVGSLMNNTEVGTNTASLVLEGVSGGAYTGETDTVYFSIVEGAVTPDPGTNPTDPNDPNGPIVPGPWPTPNEPYYEVTVPNINGITTLPGAGTYMIEDGEDFTLTIDVDSIVRGLLRETDRSVKVLVNGNEVSTENLGNGRYRVALDNLHNNAAIQIIPQDGGSTGIMELDQDVKVYGGKGMLYVETAGAARVTVYSISGQLKLDQQINNSDSYTLPQGLYIVKVGETTHKVIVK